jgi:hypothetical protein
VTLDEFRQSRGALPGADALFHFCGDFRSPGVPALAADLRRRMEARAVPRPAQARIHSVFVELAQNVVHYSSRQPAPSPAPGRFGAIALGEGDGRYWIYCTNPVRPDHAERIQRLLDQLRALPPAALSALYRRRLAEEDPRPDGISQGAGLGLITIARHCFEPVEYALVWEPNPGATLALYLGAKLLPRRQESLP